MKRGLIYFLLLLNFSATAQVGGDDEILLPAADTASFHQTSIENSTDTFSKKRFYTIAGIHAAAYTGTFLALNYTWYKNHQRSSFQVFDDSKEWQQVDKVGHAWTGYNIAKYSTGLWRWTGMKDKKAILYGGVSSLTYLTIIEFLDAHSAEWGWSWADMAANVVGTGLFTSQELLWNEQRVLFKFSAHRNNYGTPELERRADNLFGRSLPERILKDYNGQTYWFSFNLKSFFPKSNLPTWLNIAAGYGADGMFGGFENVAYDKSGNLIFDRRDIPRYRQWFLSPDIDLTKIKTNKKGVRTMLSVLNMIKIPAPALEFSQGRFKAHWLHF